MTPPNLVLRKEEENAVHWTQNDIETAIHQAFLPAHRVNTVYWSQDDHGFPIEPEFVVESDDELDINEIDEDEEPPDLLSESDSQPEGDGQSLIRSEHQCRTRQSR